MKAPDKIYMPNELLSEGWQRHIEGEDTEYVRTQAFIEKACDWLKENKDKYLYNTGESGEYIPTCSGKMIDEFRNYMKGEPSMDKIEFIKKQLLEEITRLKQYLDERLSCKDYAGALRKEAEIEACMRIWNMIP